MLLEKIYETLYCFVFAKYSVVENDRKLIVDASFVPKYRYKSTDLKEKAMDSKTLMWTSKKFSNQVPPVERISPFNGLEKLFCTLGSELQDSKQTKFDLTAVLTTLL